MRTTLTIDDDIAIRLAEIRSEEGARFKTLLNHVLRAGLAALQSADCRKPKRTFSTKTYRATCLLPETHKLVADAQLAATAMEHGLVLCSADNDFRVFPGLRFENPIG